MRSVMLALVLLLLANACKSGAEDGGATSGPSRDAGANCTSTCDDGFSCTVDRCTAAHGCVHSIGPNQGDTACPSGRYCTVEQGCIAAPACAEDEDCSEIWADDACKAETRCDPASSLCLFDLLDKDTDGHAPQVCGGDDCDDDDRDVYPGAKVILIEEGNYTNVSGGEICNGQDDDCDGVVDEGAFCAERHSCVEGSCECEDEYTCGGSCVDKLLSTEHCGECDNSCRVNERCLDGVCGCREGYETCDDACIDISHDEDNCGACGNICAVGATCIDNECACPPEETECDGVCTDVTSDVANCGTCGQDCLAGIVPSTAAHEYTPIVDCFDGECSFECAGEITGGGQISTYDCNGTCIDFLEHPKHCGSCDNECPGELPCARGVCGCELPLYQCELACVDVLVDAMNCGSCGVVCTATEQCTRGACVETLTMEAAPPTSIAVSGTHVYWTSADGTVKRVAMGGGASEVIAEAVGATALTVEGDFLYWAGSAIMRASLDGQQPVAVGAVSGTVTTISVQGDYLFWSGSCGIRGKLLEEPAGTPDPCVGTSDAAFALTPTRSYKVGFGPSGTLYGDPLPGIDNQVSVSVPAPNARSVVAVDEDVYWTQDELEGGILKYGAEGRSLVTYGQYPKILKTDGSYLYWTEDGWPTPSIQKVSLSVEAPERELVVAFDEVPSVLVIDDTSVYWVLPSLNAMQRTPK